MVDEKEGEDGEENEEEEEVKLDYAFGMKELWWAGGHIAYTVYIVKVLVKVKKSDKICSLIHVSLYYHQTNRKFYGYSFIITLH